MNFDGLLSTIHLQFTTTDTNSHEEKVNKAKGN